MFWYPHTNKESSAVHGLYAVCAIDNVVNIIVYPADATFNDESKWKLYAKFFFVSFNSTDNRILKWLKKFSAVVCGKKSSQQLFEIKWKSFLSKN